jgi:hypothetical protein
MKTVHLGTFDAEAFWRDPDLARLPALPDPAAGRIVAAMDELLFPTCQPGDLLLTRLPMDVALADYLERVGFAFEHKCADPDFSSKPHRFSQTGEVSSPEPPASIFDILDDAPPALIRGLLSGVERIAPYAIIPAVEAFCRKYSLPFSGPAPAAVSRVNSKVYSHQVAVELGLKAYGYQVARAAELVERGRRSLAGGPLLVKDPFGVAGKGNLLIQSEPMLERIGSHLAAQEKKGKRVSLVVEPFLPKKLDFSCQLHIAPDGQAHFLSLQQMHNDHLTYQGSSRLGAEQAAGLEQTGYFSQMETLAARLYRDGYWGAVCVDSMVLHDGTVIPVVEINARQSLGLINHHLDRFFGPDRLSASLACLSVGYAGPLRFAGLLAKLEGAGLLFTRRQGGGIMPLSANTLLVNLNGAEQPEAPARLRRGRFYFSIVASPAERPARLEKLRGFLKELGFSVYW